MLSELDAGHLCGDRSKRRTILCGRARFEVEGVLVRRSAPEEQQDDRDLLARAAPTCRNSRRELPPQS
jgi:hypothetical protein